MKFIDLFAGIGGFRLPLEELGHECVQTVEIDKYAVKSYNAIFNDKVEPTDITKLRPEDIADHDMLTAGFPCQSFSIAGKRAGFDDPRGNLFFEIMRIARAKRTPYLFLENVKGLLSHDKGRTFTTILQSLDECGYDAQWEVLNSKNFGVPQNRERIFIIANLRGKPRPKVFPIGRTNEEVTGEIIQLNQPTHSNDRIYDPNGLSPALNTMQGGNRQPIIKRQPLRFLDRNQKNIEGDYAFTVDASQTSGVRIDQQIRRLTPKECWRLQGFPDEAYHKAEKVNSNTQLYKQSGNAVTTNVIKTIGEKLKCDQ